jgi:hypothetical protein
MRQAEPVGSKYKKRHRRELSSTDIVEIVHRYIIDLASQAEVAK